MKTAMISAIALLMVAMPGASADACTDAEALDIGGLAYMTVGSDDFEYFYVESGAQAGAQPGGASPVFGWAEPGYEGCDAGAQDILVY